MTVPYSERQSVDYAGPQSAGHDYEFDFRLHDKSMLQVFINDGTTESEVDSSDYSVTLNLDQYANAGGKVTLTNELAYGSTLFIRSNLTVEQSSQLSASPNYNARAVEDAIDQSIMIVQDVQRKIDNKIDIKSGMGLSSNDYTTEEKNKLAGISDGATANDTDENLLNRENHTGTQAISTVTGLQTAIDDATEIKARDTWANLQTIKDSLSQGDIVYCTDFPKIYGATINVGSYWKNIDSWFGNLLSPLASVFGGFVAISEHAIDPDSTSEQFATEEALFPASSIPIMIQINGIVTSDDNTKTGAVKIYASVGGTDYLVNQINISASTLTVPLGVTIYVNGQNIKSAVYNDDGSVDATQAMNDVDVGADTTAVDVTIKISLQTNATGQTLRIVKYNILCVNI